MNYKKNNYKFKLIIKNNNLNNIQKNLINKKNILTYKKLKKIKYIIL